MMSESMLSHIRPGMQVQAADGTVVGTVREVWIGTDPHHSSERCDEDACSRLEVHHGTTTLYIPYNAIAEAAGKVVRLSVDGATVNEKGWYRRPRWIAEEAPADVRNVPHTWNT